ncbi:MAG: TVP38/TMEM64 family protein [Myxococcales bacterium]|nr:TVP38/TMEM64 family protein [Myxococcales bacterium]
MNQATIAKLGSLLLLVLAVLAVSRGLDLGFLLDPKRLQAWLRAQGILGPFLFMGLLALAVVMSPIPSIPLDIAGGLAFGPWLGTLYAASGALVGSVVSFGIARLLGRALIERSLSGHINFCGQCSDKLLTKAIFISRLIPGVSFDVVSYGAGLTKISLRKFSLATFVGMLPLTFLYVSSGAILAIGQGFTLTLGAIMVALFFLLPRWIERKNLFGLRKAFEHAEKSEGVKS